MDIISDRVIRKIEKRIKSGIRTIFIEGAADRCIYQRFYPNSNFVYGNSSDSIIQKMRICNDRFGKNPLVVAIIDRDIRTDEEIDLLAQENIYTLGIREIESIFLSEEVIRRLFGDEFFVSFSHKVQMNAANRILEDVKNYNEALRILKKNVSSKYSIRLLLKEAGVHNRGNDNNIEFLCKKMDETDSWELVEYIIPRIERTRYEK